MAFLWADGFDHWSTLANAQSVYHLIDGNCVVQNNAAIARTGTGCIQTNPNHQRGFWLPISPAGKTIISSIAVNMPSLPTTDQHGFFLATANIASYLVSVYYNTAGGISVYSGNRSVLLGKSADGVLGVNSYVSIQCRIFVDAVNGSVEVRINGASDPILSLINVNTAPVAGAIGAFGFGSLNDFSGNNVLWDDLVIFDDGGTVDNDFVGDQRCRTRYTNANGGSQDWTSLSGAAAYSELSHVPSVPATYGIVGAAAGDNSNFGLDLVPDNTSFCSGMMVFVQALKSDAGASHMNITIQSGANSSPSIGVNPGTAAAYYTGICDVDPATGTYWTKAALQAALVNFERDI